MNSCFKFLTCSASACLLLFTCPALSSEVDLKSPDEIKAFEKGKIQQLCELGLVFRSHGRPVSTITKIYIEVNITSKKESKNQYQIYENSITTDLIEKFKKQGIEVYSAKKQLIFLDSYAGHLNISLDMIPQGTVRYTRDGAIYSSYLFLANMSLSQRGFFESKDLDASNYRLISSLCETLGPLTVWGSSPDPIKIFRDTATQWVDDFIADYKGCRSI